MESIQDHYAILGVTPTASPEELRAAYKIAARRFHPDVNKSPGAATIFKDINAAYEILNDQVKRIAYDAAHNQLSNPSLGLKTFFSRPTLKRMDERQLLYTLVTIQPSLEIAAGRESDAPLNLALVLDRSTSMKGRRLQNLKRAVHRIIDDLHEQDVISVIAFSDAAEVLIPAQHPGDKRAMKALVSTMRANGATAMLAGLRSAVAQINRYRDTRYVNHIMLITDGRTYGDEDDCLALASEAHDQGVGLSGMGIGEDWNDRFLDALATRTGGSSTYIISPESVAEFMEERVRSLASAYAERAQLITAPTADIELNSVMRISPNPIALDIDTQPIPLGTIDGTKPTSLLLQFHVLTGNHDSEDFYIGRVDIAAQILGSQQRSERIIQDLSVRVNDTTDENDNPPPELLDALSKLVLFRLQDKANEAIREGDIEEATRKLEALATRLFENGEEELGQTALYEVQRVSRTGMLSEEGAKQLKYGTRGLLPTIGEAGFDD